jgi:hypothetical protein
MLVPENEAQPPAGVAEVIPTPGAMTSGFSRSEMGVGPTDEKSACTAVEGVSPAAPTEIARREVAGDEIEPAPTSL